MRGFMKERILSMTSWIMWIGAGFAAAFGMLLLVFARRSK